MAPPRSVADATRFTATGPHAFTRTSPAPAPAAPTETPQQRVARLRGAANQAKLAQVSTFDRIVDRGRIWADRAHRVVAIGLIGATVICGGITIFAYTDMVIFARRKKRAYAEEQRALHVAFKESMILAAVAAGGDEPAVRSEIEAADHLARHGKPITTRLKEWAFSGLTPPEQETAYTPSPAVAAAYTPPVAAAVAAMQRDDVPGRPAADDLVKEKTGMLGSIKGWWS